MRIALVWPESTFLIDPMVYPPLGLWFIAAAMEDAGHETDFFDLGGGQSQLDALLGQCKKGQFDQVWISGTSPQADKLKILSVALRAVSDVHTVIGGPHAMLFPEEVALYFDTVVQGEVTKENVERCVWDAQHNQIIQLGTSEIKHWLPPVRRWATQYKAELEGVPCTSMITSLGCPYTCAFCSSQALYGPVRYLPLNVVRQDIEEIARLGFGAVQFYDDILPIRELRMVAIANTLAEHELIWRCFIRSDIATRRGRGFIAHLRDKGLVELLVGVESGSNRIKRNINKRTTIQQDTLLLSWCKELGIKFKASIILGLPGETLGTLQETRDWLLEWRPDRVDVNTLIPMKGTPICDTPEKYGCKWTVDRPDEVFFKGKPDEVQCVVETDALSSVVILAHRNALLRELRSEGIPY